MPFWCVKVKKLLSCKVLKIVIYISLNNTQKERFFPIELMDFGGKESFLSLQEALCNVNRFSIDEAECWRNRKVWFVFFRSQFQPASNRKPPDCLGSCLLTSVLGFCALVLLGDFLFPSLLPSLRILVASLNNITCFRQNSSDAPIAGKKITYEFVVCSVLV